MVSATDLKTRLNQGLAMIQSGYEIVAEVRENVKEGRATLSDNEKASIMARLDRATDESLALNDRIQRA